MKKALFIIAAAMAVFFVSCKKESTQSVSADLSVIQDITTVQAFKSDAVPDADLQKIVTAGVNAQSAMNGQPWHFSVILNKTALDTIAAKMKSGMPKKAPAGDAPKDAPKGDMPDAPKDMPKDMPANVSAKAGIGDSPVAIVISAKEGSEFDAGLATELMTVEAAVLGYGTKIISSPTMVLNGSDKDMFKELLDIPDDMSAKAVILIGKYDQAESDAVTSASVRKPTEEVVSFIK